MSFLLLEYNSAQIKQRANVKMLYNSYLETLYKYNTSYRYKMIWQKHKDGYELLAKEHLKTKKREYLGKRSSHSETIKQDFEKSKQAIKEKLSILKDKLKKEEKLNKIEAIVRAPNELIKVFRKINELGLDKKIIAIGTNSLYVYEAKCALIIEQEHLATRDIDLLNRQDRGFSFVFNELMTSNKAIDLLKEIDDTFTQNENVPYRFENKEGVWVEIINPSSNNVVQVNSNQKFLEDVLPLDMDGIHWLENCRLVSELVIAENGQCANITTIHPLEYAIYKNWLSKHEKRNYEKHIRDMMQSKLVTQIINEHMPNENINEDIVNIKHLKKDMIVEYKKEILEYDSV